MFLCQVATITLPYSLIVSFRISLLICFTLTVYPVIKTSKVKILVINQRRNFFLLIFADTFINSKIIELNEFLSLFKIIFYHEVNELNKSLAIKID